MHITVTYDSIHFPLLKYSWTANQWKRGLNKYLIPTFTLLQLNSWCVGESYLCLSPSWPFYYFIQKSWIRITELFNAIYFDTVDKRGRRPWRKPHQEPLQTRSVCCRGGLKSPLPLLALCWPQQQHVRIFKGLLMVLAYFYNYLEIFTFHMDG